MSRNAETQSRPELSTYDAGKFLREGCEATHVRGLNVEYCPNDDVWTWAGKVKINGEWYVATMPDHWPEGAEVDYDAYT